MHLINGARFGAGMLALLSIVLFGCTAVSDNTEPVPQISANLEAALEEEVAQSGGELYIYIPSNAPSLDPLYCDTREMQNALSLVYEPLIRYDSTQRLSPVLAESWDALDETGTTWRINLRREVSWQGTADRLSAADVVYTMDLLRSEAYADSPYRALMDRIVSYEALDDYTLEIKAGEPGTFALHSLVFPIVSQKHFRLKKQPVGTGPYVMTFADPRQGLVFEANAAWWRRTPYIERVVALCMADNTAAMGALKMFELNYVPTNLLTASQYREQGETGILEVQSQQAEMMLINHNNVVLQDVNVRKAIAYALDRRDIISKVYLNHAFAIDVPLAPDSWLYSADYKRYDTNLELAKELLREAGYTDKDGDGLLDRDNGEGVSTLRLRLLVNDTPDNQSRKETAANIKEQLEKVGLAADVLALTWTQESNEYLRALQDGSFDLALVGFNMDMCPDLRAFLSAGGAQNYGKYYSSEMDKRLDAFAQSISEKDAINAMGQIQELFVEDLPFIQLYFRTASIVYSETLQVEGLTQARESMPYAGIEKWHFDAKGRRMFSGYAFKGLSDWGAYDTQPRPAQAQGGSTASVSPQETPDGQQTAEELETQNE